MKFYERVIKRFINDNEDWAVKAEKNFDCQTNENKIYLKAQKIYLYFNIIFIYFYILIFIFFDFYIFIFLYFFIFIFLYFYIFIFLNILIYLYKNFDIFKFSHFYKRSLLKLILSNKLWYVRCVVLLYSSGIAIACGRLDTQWRWFTSAYRWEFFFFCRSIILNNLQNYF